MYICVGMYKYIYAVQNLQKKPQSFQEPNDLVLILSVQWKGLRDELCLGSCDHKFPNSTSYEDRATGRFLPGAQLNFELWTKSSVKKPHKNKQTKKHRHTARCEQCT